MTNRSSLKINAALVYLASAIILMLGLVFMPLSRVLDRHLMEAKLYFYRLLRATPDTGTGKLALVEIDDKTTENYSFPLSYDIHGRLLDKAKKLGVKSVVFLLPLDGEQTPGKIESFTNRISSRLPVFVSYYFQERLDEQAKLKRILPPEQILKRSAGRGYVLPEPEADGVLRRSRLGMKWQNTVLPSLPLVVTAHLKGTDPDKILFNHSSVYLGNYRIPTDTEYIVPSVPVDSRRFERYSYHDILHSRKLKHLRGKVLLVGGTSGLLGTKYASPLPLNPRVSLLDSFASEVSALTTRLVIEEYPSWVGKLLMLCLAAFLGWFIPLHKTGSLWKVSLIMAGMLAAVNLGFFLLGINLPLAPALLLLLCLTPLVAAFRYVTAQSRIGEFVPNPVIEQLKDGDPGRDFRTDIREITVLFSDIKGYTTLSERHRPDVVMDLLDEYIQEMDQIVTKHGGCILNYQGDGLMMVFGLSHDPKFANHSLCAVKAALKMQEAISEMRRRWRMEYRELFVVGMGAATGMAAIGTLGSSHFRQFSVIGDTVNLAARLQSLGKELRLPLLINEGAYYQVRKTIKAEPISPTRLKGKFQECMMYEVQGQRSKRGRTHAGILAGDDNDTLVSKKIKYYREIMETLEV